MASPPETVVTVGWIAPMALELVPAIAILEKPTTKTVPGDDTLYHVGRIGGHWVVMAVCPRIGTHPANTVLANIRRSFPNIKHVLVVGIAGGLPCYGPNLQEQIVLGDVVVSWPQGSEGGVAHYEFGAWEVQYMLTASGHTLHPSAALLTAVNNLRANYMRKPGSRIPQLLLELRECLTEEELPEFEDPGDEHDYLFPDDFLHLDREKLCQGLCDLARSKQRSDRGSKATRKKDSPRIHYGTIGSANTLVVSSAKRNELYRKYQIICFEMESAGVISDYQALVIRGICDYSDSHKNKKWQKYAAATAAAYAKEVLLLVPPAKLDERGEMSGFKPGDLVLSFFFHGRGHQLQKTALGFFRSLLHQVLRQAPDALRDVVEIFNKRRREMGEPGKKWEWHQEELRRFFESSLPKVLEARSVWLFVDALDECGKESAVDLFRWFQSLLRTPLPTGSQCRICVTCRHYPILSSDCEFEICPEHENGQDISTYVRVQLSDYRYLNASPIPALIIDSASGVFMWAHLVINQVLDLEREGAELEEIQAAVHSIPPDLDELYRGLIQRMSSTSTKLIQWICFATRPLTLDELKWAMVVEVDCQHRSLKACQSSQNYISDNTRMETRVRALSCGLAEVTQSSYKQVVQFIHQSVKDFFVETGLSFLDSSFTSADAAIGMAHYRLSRICIRYLAMDEISQSTSHEHTDFPFLAYATISWVAHTKQCDVRSLAQDDLVGLFSWPSNDLVDSWVRVYTKIDPYSNDCPPSGTSLVHVMSRYGILGPLIAILQRGDQVTSGIDTRDDDGRTPLSWAAANGSEPVVKLLLDTGKVDVDSKDNIYSQTPLSLAAGKGHEAVVKLLLDTAKVDVNSKDSKYYQTPLSWAAEKGHEAIVKLLLNTGKVDINSNNIYGQTLLSWAAEKGHEAIVKLLLDTGKADVDSKTSTGRTPLSWAAEKGHEAIVKLLLDTGKVDVDSKDSKYGQTPLSWAAEKGHEAIVKLLLDTGKVDVNSNDKCGRTPLLWAAVNGREAVVKLLLDTGKVDVDSKNSEYGRTPLWWAAANEHKAVVKLLELAK
ncbi:hypothetical protein DL765_006049 [Monosporascus sp. GIB2]|nr:hypothetical protein DL765_006049 [Monosporascus sp. GIB2]